MISALTAQGVPIHLVCPGNYQFRDELSQNSLITLHPTQPRSVDTRRGLWSKIWTNSHFLVSSCTGLVRAAGKGSIVHFQHLLHFPFSALFFAAAKLRGCTIVFTVHDPVPHNWLLPVRLRWIERRSLAWAYRTSEALIVHSEPGKRALIDRFGLSADKITVIGRGPYGLGGGIIPMPDSRRLEILLFGSIRENKGVHLAIEAVQALYREGAAVRLTIAGDVMNSNEASYWDRCLARIAMEPAPIRLRKEFLPDELLPELFAGCHCLVLPYTAFFSDSGVAFMALANGRPIIATRAGGLGPLLDAAELGITIRESTPEGVRDALRRALDCGVEELARLGRSGADYVNMECGWPKVALKTREVYARYTEFAGPVSEPSRLRTGAMPRIVFHSPEPKSAAARYVWELVTALAAEGVAMSVACPRNFQFAGELEANPAVRLVPTRERPICNKRSLPTRVRDNLIFLAASLLDLVRATRRGDIVHFQFLFHLPFGALFFLAMRLRGCTTILTVHDPIPHRWLLHRRLRWLERRVLGWAYGLAQALIAHSEPGKRVLVEYFGRNADKISVIAHGPYALGHGIMAMPGSETLELLLFGSIRENKGIHLAIEAVQTLHAEAQPVRLTIAGDVLNSNEETYWAYCRGLIARRPESVVVRQEFLPDEQLPALFANCHCVLLPYTAFFSDSGVAQMALANGRPVLATRSGGLGPLLQNAELGIPIEEHSVTGVVRAIRIALRLGLPALELLGKNGAAAVNGMGGWKQVAVKTQALYVRQGALPHGRPVVSQSPVNSTRPV